MKILTLTTQYANNMGALLQCYALSKFLNEQKDVECEVIQYFPKGAMRSWELFPKARSFRDILKNVYKFIRFDLLIIKIRKFKEVRKFINENIPLTEEGYDRQSIVASPPVADAYVCGSDQIWNFKLRTDLTYFLDFTYGVDNCKRISYAPSIADPWTLEKALYIKPYLERFHALSIREQANLEQVSLLAPERKPVVVADPVFLLNKDQWNKIARIPSIDEPYILCYFLSVSDLAVQTVKKIQTLTGYKIIHLNLNALDKFDSDTNMRVADPSDFVGLISKAAIVCTNSFHCSAFSVIYNRNFCFIPKGMANERVENLVKNFNLGNVFISHEKLKSLTLPDLEIDYCKGEESGQRFISNSKDYLLRAIYEN